MGIGVSSLCAFELFKEFGLSGEGGEGSLEGADKFLNLAGIVIPIVGAAGTLNITRCP